jgi:hypothetical protein
MLFNFGNTRVEACEGRRNLRSELEPPAFMHGVSLETNLEVNVRTSH